MRQLTTVLPVLRPLSVLLFAVAMAGMARADTVTESFAVKADGLLEVDTDVGLIKVSTHNASEVIVEVERGGADGEKLELDFTTSGNTVRVVGKFDKDNRGWWNGNRAKVEYQIKVPTKFNVDLRTRGGSIGVDDLNGTLEANTSGGSLRFGRIEGRVNAKTSGGSIRVDGGGADIDVRTSGGSITIGDVTGDVEAKTSGGSVRIKNARGKINARTSGGSVEATMLVQPSGSSTLSTSGGSVRLYVAEGIGLDIDATSSSGVRSEIPVDGKTRGDRRLRGAMNGGGPEVRLSTNGGGVKIYKLDD